MASKKNVLFLVSINNLDMKITLNPFCEKHLDNTYCWMQDDKLRKDFMLSFLVTKDSHKEWYNKVLRDVTQKIWAIYADQIHVGNVGLKYIDLKNRKAECWIYIGNSSMHGKHVGTYTWRTLFEDYEFVSMGLHKLYSYVAEWNIASQKMFLNAGFIEEGFLRDEVLFDSNYVSLFRYGKILNK